MPLLYHSFSFKAVSRANLFSCAYLNLQKGCREPEVQLLFFQWPNHVLLGTVSTKVPYGPGDPVLTVSLASHELLENEGLSYIGALYLQSPARGRCEIKVCLMKA